MLHDRTGFQDWPEPERRRHLLRLWLAVPGARELPPVFAARCVLCVCVCVCVSACVLGGGCRPWEDVSGLLWAGSCGLGIRVATLCRSIW